MLWPTRYQKTKRWAEKYFVNYDSRKGVMDF